jgi:Methyl-accepting chemotaxis protein
MITRPLAVAVASAQRIASGDLTQSISTTRGDEAGQLLNALADMQGGLKHTIEQIASASNQLASAAEELSAVTEESTRGLTRQNDEIQQAATAVNEMTAAVEEVARNAVSTSEACSNTSVWKGWTRPCACWFQACSKKDGNSSICAAWCRTAGCQCC